MSGGPSGIQTTSDRFGNTLTDAFNMGRISNANYTWSDRVNRVDVNDYLRFSLSATNTVTLTLSGMGADADIELLDGSGNLVAASRAGGSTNELITRSLVAGNYFVRVLSFNGSDTGYSLRLQASTPAADPGSTLATAHDFGTLNWGFRNWSDRVTTLDTNDYYRFNLVGTGNFNLSLSGLTADADVQLLNSAGTVLASSVRGGSLSESITQALTAGTYFVRVYSFASANNTSYALSISAGGPGDGTTDIVTGTLRNDRFTVRSTATRTVVSSYGNVDFGGGLRDVLDLSSIWSTTVSLNLANSVSGGVAYNPGAGSRIFDAINFSDGRQILFEGVDAIRFADRTINLSVRTNDPLFNQQWNLFMMGVHNAWRFTTGSTGILVGVQDSGLATNSSGAIHGDLRSTTIFSNNYRDESIDAGRDSHGTAVQSIIAAATNNGIGMSGINWNSRVINIDVIGGNANDQSLAQATQNMINDANANGQRLVINMSLGYPGSFGNTSIDPAFNQIVANNPNVLFVIAAGNEGQLGRDGLSYPSTLAALYSNVMAIGASWGTRDAYGNSRDPGERINYSGWWGSQYGSGLTLMGPSEVVAAKGNRSTVFDYFTGSGSRFNGTSAATPNVTGVASLVWSANRSLTAAQIKQILSQTSVDLHTTGYDRFTGSGFVNADAAVRRAMSLSRGIA
ncbi:S8 family serine peptidase [Pseudanabaenaceae cyanobacterium LEGE 13415]|nr:S8 family serine peptidase [Pseudanabaenaceae cyanobacterium LEGE 13415]